MRSEFQDVFKDAYDHWIDDACSHRYNASKSLALQVWQHQQSKVDELQKQLIEQGQRFNVQTQQIASLKWQLKRLGYTDNGGELMKPPIGDAPKFDLLDELQKRVDEQGLIIANVMSIASELQKSWEVFEIGKKLEQALKGGGDE